MCDPFTITGIALTGASMAANAAAQSRVQKARDDALAAERIRQRGFDQEADALNLQSQNRYEDFQGKQDEKAQSLGDYFTQQQVAEPAAAQSMPATSSNIAVKEESKQRGKARDFTNQVGLALGDLRSFGDLLGDTSRLQARDASLVSQLGGFKRGSSEVVPYELEAANQKGAGLRFLGDILGGVGGLATNAGLGGSSLPRLFGGSGGVASSALPKIGPLIPNRPAFGGNSVVRL